MHTLEEIKAAVDAGQTVHWKTAGYRVIKDSLGQYLVGWNIGGHGENYIGLTHRDGVTLNGKPSDFYVAPAPNYAAALAALGERVWGPHWPSGMARLTGCSVRTLYRVQDAAKAGHDYRTARAILAQVSAQLTAIAADVRPWTHPAY